MSGGKPSLVLPHSTKHQNIRRRPLPPKGPQSARNLNDNEYAQPLYSRDSLIEKNVVLYSTETGEPIPSMESLQSTSASSRFRAGMQSFLAHHGLVKILVVSGCIALVILGCYFYRDEIGMFYIYYICHSEPFQIIQ